MSEESTGSPFTLEKFKAQLRENIQPGLMIKMLSLIPGMASMKKQMEEMMPRRDALRLIGIIDAMTRQERDTPRIIDESRRIRIARGAGVTPAEVSSLVRQFEIMEPMLTAMSGKDLAGRQAMLAELPNEFPRSPLDPAVFQVGMAVEDPKFGRGVILELEERRLATGRGAIGRRSNPAILFGA